MRIRILIPPALLIAALSLMAATSSVWDGVYSKPQAARGKAAYGEDCAKCHGENLGGGEGAPALVGQEFVMKWQGKTADDLFELIQKTMPSDDPGNLSRRKCADLTAYILSANDYPAGNKELDSSAAVLADIHLDPKK